MGGLCIPDRGVSDKANIFVSLAGPFAGFSLAGIYWLVEKYASIPATSLSSEFRSELIYLVNIGYGALNLLPIFPLDGGQAFKSFLKVFKFPGAVKIAFVVSIIFLIAGAAATVYYKQYFLLIIVAWLASDNWKAYQAEKS